MGERHCHRKTSLALEELEEILPGGTEPERKLEARELGQFMKNYVNQMKEPEQSVFLCRYWYMASVKEIASRFGFGESRVKSMLSRSRKKLKTALVKEGLL